MNGTRDCDVPSQSVKEGKYMMMATRDVAAVMLARACLGVPTSESGGVAGSG